jgi:hypothetical protein
MSKLGIYITGILLIIGMGYTIYSLKAENKRLNNNIIALKDDNSRQLLLTKSELQQFYGKQLDSLSKALDIKLKNVTNIIITKYNYKDTVIKHVAFDTVKIEGSEKFLVSKGCFKVEGSIDKTGLNIKTLELNDKLTTFIYKDYYKRFLFIKYRPYYTCKVYSECKKDTVHVETNIKVIK